MTSYRSCILLKSARYWMSVYGERTCKTCMLYSRMKLNL
uniref:Uncharacterized protein n=1 Tax=Zea mays TaxID=4577 RepID=B4FDW1_MAIZE|nr:unknown [Zea mays]